MSTHTSTTPREVLAAAFSPRMLVLLVILLAGALVAFRLGVWQWDRAQVRGSQQTVEAQLERERADPVPLSDMLAVGEQVMEHTVGVRVEVAGRWSPEPQFLVPDRQRDGEPGWLVVAALDVAEGGEAGALLPVVRGWVADPVDAEPQPQGAVRVVGALGAAEGYIPLAVDAPSDNVGSISPAQLANLWHTPIYAGFVVAADVEPDASDAILAMPAPTAEGGGINLRNLAYAAEWWVFGGFALFLWGRLVRDEVQHRREEHQAEEGRHEERADTDALAAGR